MYKYEPSKGFIPGIPSRDLEDAEFNALPKELQDRAISSKAYLAPVPAAAEVKTESKKEVTNDNSK